MRSSSPASSPLRPSPAPLPASLREILVGRIAELSRPGALGPPGRVGRRPADRRRAPRDRHGDAARGARRGLAGGRRPARPRGRRADRDLPVPPRAARRGRGRGPAPRRAATAARGRRPLADRSFATGRRWPAKPRPATSLHWSAADVPPEAFEASVRAARDALGVHAYADALRQFERAIAFWDRVPDAAERSAATTSTCSAMPPTPPSWVASPNRRSPSRPRRSPTSAIGRPRAGGPHPCPPRPLPVAHRRAARPPRGDPARGRAHPGRSAVRGTRPRSSATSRRRSCRPVAIADRLAEGALALLRAADSHEGEVRLFNILGVDLVGLGEIETGLDHLRQGVEGTRGRAGARAARDPARPRVLPAPDGSPRGGPRDGDGRHRDGRRLGLELRFAQGFQASAGDMLFRLGRWDEADKVLWRASSTRTPTTPAPSTCERSGSCSSRLVAIARPSRQARGHACRGRCGRRPRRAGAGPPGLRGGRPARWPGGRRAPRHRRHARRVRGSDETFLIVAPLLVVGMHAAGRPRRHRTGRSATPPGWRRRKRAGESYLLARARELEEAPAARHDDHLPSVPRQIALRRRASPGPGRRRRTVFVPAAARRTGLRCSRGVPAAPPPPRRACRAIEVPVARRPTRCRGAAERPTWGGAALWKRRERRRSARVGLGAGRAAAEAAAAPAEAKAADPRAGRDPRTVSPGVGGPRLVAAGRSNGEIAEALFISPNSERSRHAHHGQARRQQPDRGGDDRDPDRRPASPRNPHGGTAGPPDSPRTLQIALLELLPGLVVDLPAAVSTPVLGEDRPARTTVRGPTAPR